MSIGLIINGIPEQDKNTKKWKYVISKNYTYTNVPDNIKEALNDNSEILEETEYKFNTYEEVLKELSSSIQKFNCVLIK